MTAFQPLSLEDLFKLDLPDPEWLVDGIAPIGAGTLLAAREKAGKGFLTIDLCACVSTEEPFLDRAVKAGPAIYCAAEENIRDVRDRIQHRIGTVRDAPFHVLPLAGFTPDRLDLTDPDSMGRLREMIEGYRPVLVVIDTLREVHTGQEDKSDDMGPILRPVRTLAHEFNCAIIVNHHMSRAGGSRGSTAIPAAFDQILTFSRDDDGGTPEGEFRGVLKIDGRYSPRMSISISFGKDRRWTPTAPRLVVAGESNRGKVLGLLASRSDGLTSSEISALLKIEKKTIQNLLSEMKQEIPPPFVWTRSQGRGGQLCYFPLQSDLFPPEDTPLRRPGTGNEQEPPSFHFRVDGDETETRAGARGTGRGCGAA